MKYCTYPYCGGNHYAKGYCQLHYDRLWRGTLDDPPKRTKKAAAFEQRPRQCICRFCGGATPHKILREVVENGCRMLWFGCLRCKDMQSAASVHEPWRKKGMTKMQIGKGRL